MISLHKLQTNDLNYLQKEYKDDAIFMLFMHYLYFFEIKDEKIRLKSLSQEEPIDKNFDDIFDNESEYEEEEEEESINVMNQIPIPDKFRLPISNEELKNLPNKLECSLENPKNKEIFIWLTLYRFGDLIDDVISSNTQEKLQNYIPVIKFLRSLGISILEFHVFLLHLNDTEFDQFRRISHIFNLNQINVIASKLQFLESMSYFHEAFFDKIVSNIINGNLTNDDFLKFISLESLVQKNQYTEKVDTSDIRTKINFPFIVYPFGRIKYNSNGFDLSSELDPTIKSKIAVCLVHSLNYLTNLPFTFQIHINKTNIYLDENNGLPFIIMNPLNETDPEYDYFNYEIAIDSLKTIIKLLTNRMKDNKFLNVILNYKNIHISPSEISFIHESANDYQLKSYLPFQYIFELFLDETLDFTFKGTNQDEYKIFLDSKIINDCYTNDQFRQFAYELLGQSYGVKLHYLFTRLKPGLDLTIDRFVDEMNSITRTIKLPEFLTNRKVLIEIANLFEHYFEEIPFNLVHKLNQLSEPLYKAIDKSPDTNKYLEYNRGELNDETISYIYHINNNFVSPMIYSNKGCLYFDVPKTKLIDKINEIGKWTESRLNILYYSLHSALYYLSKYCDQEKLLPKDIEFEDIYINEKDEVIVPPFKVNDMKQFIIEFFKKIGNSFEDSINSSSICYSYASYLPLTNEQSYKLMRLFGLDYLNELNEFFITMGGFESNLTADDISNKFEEKCKHIEINDEHILYLSSDVNKLSPLFIHLLEKAMQSENEKISNEAKRRFNIFKSIKEIKDIEKSSKMKNINAGESQISIVKYKGKDVVFKVLKCGNQNFTYLQKMKNMLYLLKIEDQNEVSKYIANEIGFANFGILMDLYKQDLFEYLKSCHDGFELLKIFLKIINIISFLHSRNIVHCDIKTRNFLIDDQLNVYLGDNLNIQKVTALSRVTLITPEYHSHILKSLIQQDIYAFEVSCYRLFYKTDHSIVNPPFMNYKCPMIDYICESKDLDDSRHTGSMTVYRELLHHPIYVLPQTASKSDEDDMYKKFQVYLNENGEMVD